MSMTLLPAVDVAGGRASQVSVGAVDEPRAVAQQWVDAGAQWLHVVDLDRAFRRGDNADLLASMVESCGVRVQLSGGIESAVTARSAIATGAARVNLASTVATDLALVEGLVAAYGPRIVIGLDMRGTDVVARGSDVPVGRLRDLMPGLADAGCHEFLVADASRDGSRRGVDTDVFHRAIETIGKHVDDPRVVVSGGVAGLRDLAALRRLEDAGVWGVVLGSALHQGAFTLQQARQAVSA